LPAKTEPKTLTHAEKAEASLKAAEDARVTVTQRAKDVQNAQVRVDAIKSAWSRGDDSVSADEMTAAKQDVERCEVLLRAAEAKVKVTERSIITATPDLAEAIAWSLGGRWLGIPITATTEEPRNPGTLPAIFVVQKRPAVGDGGGGLVGKVSLILVGPLYVQPLDGTAVMHALASRGVSLNREPVSSSATLDEATRRDLVELDVMRACPEIPVLPGPAEDSAAGHAAGMLATRLQKQLQSPTALGGGVRGGGGGNWGGDSGARLMTARVERGGGTVISHKVDAHGIARTVARLTVIASTNDSSQLSVNTMAARMSAFCENPPKEWVSLLGRVQSGKVVSNNPVGKSRSTLSLEAEFVFIGKK